jgi:putative transposase
MAVAELRRLRQLEEENSKLSSWWPTCRWTSTCSRGDHKKALKPARKRELVRWLQSRFDISQRRACGLMQIVRASFRYQSRRPEPTALRICLRDPAASRVKYGYRRLHVLLRREGTP